jgi:hypothetical protein
MNKRILHQAGFSEEVRAVEQGDCPLCKRKVNFEISGFMSG